MTGLLSDNAFRNDLNRAISMFQLNVMLLESHATPLNSTNFNVVVKYVIHVSMVSDRKNEQRSIFSKQQYIANIKFNRHSGHQSLRSIDGLE